MLDFKMLIKEKLVEEDKEGNKEFLKIIIKSLSSSS